MNEHPRNSGAMIGQSSEFHSEALPAEKEEKRQPYQRQQRRRICGLDKTVFWLPLP